MALALTLEIDEAALGRSAAWVPRDKSRSPPPVRLPTDLALQGSVSLQPPVQRRDVCLSSERNLSHASALRTAALPKWGCSDAQEKDQEQLWADPRHFDAPGESAAGATDGERRFPWFQGGAEDGKVQRRGVENVEEMRNWERKAGGGGSIPRGTHRVQDEDALLLARSRQEGPPGPAGAVLALPGLQGQPDVLQCRDGNSGPALAQNVAWLFALKALGLPFDGFHLGLTRHLPQSASPTALETHNVSAVLANPWQPRRWHLLVQICRVELLAGEIDITVCDPTGEASATVDRRVHASWPRAICEGAVLLLGDVVSVPPVARARYPKPRLLIMQRSLARAFTPSDVPPVEASELLVAAAAVRARPFQAAEF